MSTKERIMTIRLLDKIAKQPVYAGILGIEVALESAGTSETKEPP